MLYIRREYPTLREFLTRVDAGEIEPYEGNRQSSKKVIQKVKTVLHTDMLEFVVGDGPEYEGVICSGNSRLQGVLARREAGDLTNEELNERVLVKYVSDENFIEAFIANNEQKPNKYSEIVLNPDLPGGQFVDYVERNSHINQLAGIANREKYLTGQIAVTLLDVIFNTERDGTFDSDRFNKRAHDKGTGAFLELRDGKYFKYEGEEGYGVPKKLAEDLCVALDAFVSVVQEANRRKLVTSYNGIENPFRILFCLSGSKGQGRLCAGFLAAFVADCISKDNVYGGFSYKSPKFVVRKLKAGKNASKIADSCHRLLRNEDRDTITRRFKNTFK